MGEWRRVRRQTAAGFWVLVGEMVVCPMMVAVTQTELQIFTNREKRANCPEKIERRVEARAAEDGGRDSGLRRRDSG